METKFRVPFTTVTVLVLLAGSASAQPPSPGFALNYGSGAYVSVSSGRIPTAGDFTVECWARAEDFVGFPTIISQGPFGNAFYICNNSTNNTVSLGDGWVVTGIAFPFNAWHHFAVVKTAGSASFYLDGVLKTNRASAIPNPPLGEMRFGRQFPGGPGTGQWVGPIDEVRIWNSARTQTQLTNNMHRLLVGNEANLVSYWRFDEGPGFSSTFPDSGVAGSLVGPPSWLLSTIPFVPGAVTGNATNVTGTAATLKGTVYFNSSLTAAWFEWGTTTNYGSQTATAFLGVNGSNLFSANLSNLVPATVYHFRLAASNVFGLTFGTNRSFVTLGTNANLAALTGIGIPPSIPLEIIPVFAPGITNYACSVVFARTNIRVTATSADINATMLLIHDGGYSTLTSGSPSPFLALAVGPNVFPIGVFAEDASIAKTYTLTVNRLPPAPTVSTEAADLITTTSARLAGFVNPNGGDVQLHFEWGLTTSYGNATPTIHPGSGTSDLGFTTDLANLIPGTIYHFRMTATNAGGLALGQDRAFTTLVSTNAYLASLTLSTGTIAPAFSSNLTAYTAAVNNGVSSVTVTPIEASATAVIQIRVNGGSFAVVTSGDASSPLPLNVGANTIEVLVTAQDGVTAKDYVITINRAPTLPTLPTVITLPATSVSANGATLNGSVNPNGSATTAWFEWGPTTNYGNMTVWTNFSATASALDVTYPFVRPFVDLSPVSIHYRVVATNAAGRSDGLDRQFTMDAIAAAPGGDLLLGYINGAVGFTFVPSTNLFVTQIWLGTYTAIYATNPLIQFWSSNVVVASYPMSNGVTGQSYQDIGFPLTAGRQYAITVQDGPLSANNPLTLEAFTGSRVAAELLDYSGVIITTFGTSFNTNAFYYGPDFSFRVVPSPTPLLLINPVWLVSGAFQFGFTNASGATFTVLGSTNVALPLSNWTELSGVTEVSPGHYQFTDSQATNHPHRFYRVRSP